ncbi:hypothetical protein P175DRAFT_0426745 [Aspergillus ochraceoroseus IBT 24754]|uniref:O-methyltransferase domain-containing protein n=1 Tax=Aspergillus ochraceoroseus IBT 24754 TaxID=1392256 RepID=A0A2T5MA68_9EURO|nr:uncharacterized protein P175DRAFT_0426745 [Aspergillus ochraceoroseus IBT 24754]PTU25434.1 hypothetical protein P175DRAFT_0426745 [Aspergillus ochraceoroseus IBT 24754]
MATMSQLEAYTSELAAAVKALSTHCEDFNCSRAQFVIPLDAPSEAHRAQQSALATIARLQTILAGPADFLHHLAVQNQLLACLHWLGEFQVLACIPIKGSVPIKDVADLAGVPEVHLSRVVRMMTTAGFLQEPQPGTVAHSALSAPFVTKPAYLDVSMFLAGTAAPAALQMATATQRFGPSVRPNETAYNLAFNTSTSLATLCEQQPKLQRQWPAFLRYGTSDTESCVTDLLARMDQLHRGNISVVVEVGATSTDRAVALANLYPSVHFIVQMIPPSSGWISPIRPPTPCSRHDDPRQLSANSAHTGSTLGTSNPTGHAAGVSVQQRAPATPQLVSDAAVYILNLPSPSPSTSFSSLFGRIMAELRAHLDILRANPAATLVLIPRLLPETGTVNPEVEASARLRDLSLLQLANERELELAELLNMLHSVSDNMGRLVVVNKLQSRDSVAIVLEVRYQTYNR